MAVYVLSDLHLSTANPSKSMDVFGKRWQRYTERLAKNWRAIVEENDTVIIPGDISWELSLSTAASDFHFLDNLPGKKILGKGNHDFWWTTIKKMNEFLDKENIRSISFLYNNAFVAEDFIIAGTRGWYQDESCDNMPENADFHKLIARETARLKISLDAAKALQAENYEKEIVVFLHFPVSWNGRECAPLLEVLLEHGIRRCYFGHIHANYTQPRIVTLGNGALSAELISADFLEFIPKRIPLTP